MKIEIGLQDHMVLQRTSTNMSAAPFSGTTGATGDALATVTQDGRVVKGFERAVVGRAEDGSIGGEIAGLPVGGPYVITIEVGASSEKCMFEDVLVGDVWVMAGQSNMEGVGDIRQALAPHPMVHAFYMDDHWDVAVDPVNDLSMTIDQVHADLREGVRPLPLVTRGTTLGPAYGQEMYRLTGVPQGLIASAHGGTSMQQWSPGLKDLGSKSLYGATLRRVAKNGGRVAGILWYQGCSEADAENASPVYTERMKALIAAFRADFDDPDLPVMVVQIATHAIPDVPNDGWNKIQMQQYELPNVIPNLTVVPAIDLTLDDGIHLSGNSQHRLGCRLALAAHALIDGAGEPPITIDRITYTKNELHEGADLWVTFKNVVDGLHAGGRANGFVLVSPSGDIIPPYRVDLVGSSAVLFSGIEWDQLKSMSLHYGFGRFPFCNIVDAADRAVPVFGPIALETAVSPRN